MKAWQQFWQNYRIVDVQNDEDLLYQVGKTVNRQVINSQQFQDIVREVKDLLELEPTDNLLDLCCGNGVLTYETAQYAKSVIGVDFSEPYIENASRFKAGENIDYLLHDVKKLSQIENFLIQKKINKVLIYDAMAYFSIGDLDDLLGSLCRISAESTQLKILLASVLDRDKMWRFFNTFQRKFEYLVKIKMMGKSKGLGRWWTRKELGFLAHQHRLNCRCIDQNGQIHTAHYRINVLLWN